MAKKPKTLKATQQIPTAERNAECVRLRTTTGMTYREIGERLGCGTMSAHRAIQAALKEISDAQSADAATIRQVEEERLDNALENLMKSDAYKAGDTQAINTFIRLSESRRKIWGADMPTQIEVKTDTSFNVVIQKARSDSN